MSTTVWPVALPELCGWLFQWINPEEQEGMERRHLELHVAARERLLREMERGAPEEQAWAAQARAWMAAHEGELPI